MDKVVEYMEGVIESSSVIGVGDSLDKELNSVAASEAVDVNSDSEILDDRMVVSMGA